MKVHFWGVRGSIPTPLTPEQVQAKITACVERITPKDLESEDSRMKFLASLPPWIYGTIGGNSPCVQLTADNGSTFLLDAGTGLRAFSKQNLHSENKHYHLFFSHFHWDHIQGLPFFEQAFDARTRIDVYSTFPAAEKILSEQSRRPYFPKSGSWDSMKNQFHFHLIKEGEPFYLNDVLIQCHKMKHPGNSYSWSFTENGKKFIYSTDVELQSSDFDKSIPQNHFFADADVLVLDSQYTVAESLQKENWGHSTFCYAIDFAELWNVKKMYLFHHEPTYDDKKIHYILQSGKTYEDYKTHCNVELYLAQEGQEFTV